MAELLAEELEKACRGDRSAAALVADRLENASPTLQMFHGPEALAAGVRAGGEGVVEVLRAVTTRRDASAVTAARALWLSGAAASGDVVRVAANALDDPNLWWHGVFLAGEIGAAAGSLAAKLAEIFELCRGLMPLAAQAYVRATGPHSIGRLRDWLADPELAAAAASAAGGLGRVAAPLEPSLGDLVTWPPNLRAATAAFESLCRVCADVAALAPHTRRGLAADRWLRIWVLRRLAEVGQTRRAPERRVMWPREWWPAFYANVDLADCSQRDELDELVMASLEDGDADVVRNAVLALAATESSRAKDAIGALVEDKSVGADAADALRVLGVGNGSGVRDTDLYLSAPSLDRATAAAIARDAWVSLDHAKDTVRVTASDAAHQLLAALAAEERVVFHGSSTRALDTLVPTRLGTSDNPLTDQVGVFADVDPVIPHFYAVLDRGAIRSVTNGRHDVDGETRYLLALDFHAIVERPFRSGSVYVLPREGFTYADEWANPRPVRPLAEVHVEPDGHPLLGEIWSSDLGKPINDAVEREFTALWHTAHYPTRSA